MEFNKHRQKWSLMLTGLFVLSVCLSALSIRELSGTHINHGASTFMVLYAGLGFVFLSGTVAIWFAMYTGRTGVAQPGRTPVNGFPGPKAPTPEVRKPTPPRDAFLQYGHTTGQIAVSSVTTHPDAMPEYREGARRSAPILLADNIAERKRIALEMQQQNKKITESINYARRIQSAILPNLRLIHRVLPDSFILYKPRDVVSGDFPWFAHVKNEIFMAAVDCTGHGVPGALLSLVGYFLLNDIVRSRRITDPGKILDLLDEGVSTTLRPSEDAGTKDGMDISLCKINMETRQVEYAGAHRPLYLVRNGVFEEIKGNKFPIGGGIFKNQTSFTNYSIRLNKGDSIFYFSDGYCDQFGGPDGKKFGTRQLKQIISRVHTMPMRDAHHVFDEEWEKWRGNQKQIDDVLLIGVKF